MRKPLTVEIEEAVLEAATARAQEQERSLTEYIEALLLHDLELPARSADADVRDYRAVLRDTETQDPKGR